MTVTAGTIGVASGGVLQSGGTLNLVAFSSSSLNPAIGLSGAGTLSLTATANSATSPDINFCTNDTANSTANYGCRIATPVNLGSLQRYIWGKTDHNSVDKYLLTGADCQFAGSISGAGGLTFIAQDAYTGSSPMETPFCLNAANSFAGPVIIQRGSVYLGAAGAFPSGNQLTFNVASGNNGKLFLYGHNTTVSNLTSLGAGNAWIANGNRNPSGIGPATLTVVENTSGTYSGTIVDTNLEYAGTSVGFSTVLSLLVTGSGKLTLSGANTYSGSTTVSNGTLVGVTGGYCVNSAVTVMSNGTLGISVAPNTQPWTNGILTFNSGTTYLDFNYGAVTPSTTLAPLQVNGNVAFTGTPTVTVEAGSLPLGTGSYPLMTWTGTQSGTPPTSVSLSPSRIAGNLSISGNTLYLNITANTEPIRWAVVPGSGTWDINTTENWKGSTGAATYYLQPGVPGDQVVLDETYITAAPTITLNTTVSPGSVTVSNTVYAYTISGTGGIAGSGGLTTLGTGSLTLNNPNTFTGPTTISGSVTIGGSGELGGGAYAGAITDNGTFTYNSSAAQTLSGVISGTGTVTGDSGTLILSGANTYTGASTLNGGTVNLGAAESAGVSGPLGQSAAANPGSIVLGGGTLQYSSANANDYSGRFSTAPGQLYNVDTAGQSVTWATALTSSGGSLTKVGAGTLTLNGVNTYSGGTTLNVGALAIGNGSALGTGTLSVNLASAGTFLTVANTAAVALSNNLVLPAPASAGTYVLVKNSASSSTGTSLSLDGNISGGNANLALELNSSTSGDDTTTYLFGGTNTFVVSEINLNRGAIVVASPSGLGNSSNLVYLDGNNNAALGDLRFAISMTLTNPITIPTGSGGGPIGTGTNNVTLLGKISGTVALNMVGNGTLTLACTNVYTGGTKISSGILNVSATETAGTSGPLGASGTISFAGGTLQYSPTNTFDYSSRFSTAASQAYSIDTAGQNVTFATGLTSSGGTLTKNGAGILTLLAANTCSGATTINGGILCSTSSFAGPVVVQAGGTLALGTNVSSSAVVSTLTLGSTLTFNAGGTNFMRLSKTGGTATSDVISGGTAITYGGTLVATNITSDTNTLALGDSFTLFNGFSSYSGGFNSVVLPALPVGLSWNLTQLTVNGSIAVINTASTPVFNPPAGNYIGAQAVVISSTTPGATIYYTINNWATTNTYTAPVAVPVGTTLTIQAFAKAAGYANSAVASAAYLTEPAAVWTDVAGGSWSVAGNWTNNVIPNAGGVTADFSQLTLAADTFVTLDGPQTVGNLIFGDMGSNYTWEVDAGSSGPLTLAATNPPTITVLNETTTIGAVLAGTNGLTVAGPGTLVLTSASTYTGATTVGNGTLQINGSIVSGALTVATNGTLQTGGAGVLGGGTYAGLITDNGAVTCNSTAAQTLNGIVSGVGVLTEAGSGTLTLNGVNSYSGGTVLNGGSLTIGNGAALGAGALSVNLAASGTFLTVANTAAVAIPNDIVFPAPASAVTCTLIKNSPGATTGTQLSFNGTLSGGNANMELFLNSNTGSDNTTTYLFAGTNTFLAADINLNRGSIIVASPSGLGDPSNLIEIDANNNYTLGDLRFAISMTLTNPIELVWDANNIGVGTNNVTLLGPISGTGPLNKVGTGTLTLGTANSYSGVTTVSNGTLEVDGSAGAGAVTINGGTLDGIGSISGAVTIKNGGTLAAGNAAGLGTLSISGALTLNSGSTNLMRISKTGGSTASDSLSGMSSFTWAGTLIVTNVTSDANQLAAGDTFYLFNAGASTGAFATVSLPALLGGMRWDLSALATSGSITVSAAAPTPVFNPPAGGYAGALRVTITSQTNATIHYTTDGSDPASSPTVLSGSSPVTVTVPVNTTNLTLTAYATQSGLANSGEASAAYSTIATPTWINLNSDNWSDTSAWSNNVVANGVGVTADFSQLTLTADTTVTLDIAATVGNLIFADQGNAYNWTLATGGAGPLTLSATNTPTLTVVSNQSLTIGAVLAGTHGLVTTGAGTNIWTVNPGITAGGITVNAGTFEVTADNFGGTFTPIITVNTNGTILGDSYHSLGGGTTVVINHGTWLLNYEDYKENLTMMDGLIAYGGGGDGGQLRVGLAGGSGSYTWNVANSVAGSVVDAPINTISSGVTLTWNVARGAAPYDLTLGGIISNAGNLVFSGNGLTAMTNVNTYSGSTTVNGGTLAVNGALASAVTVAAGATLGGSGAVNGGATVENGGAIQGGDVNYSNTLTVATALNLGVNSTDVTSSRFTLAAGGQIAATTALNVYGTNIVTVLDTNLVVGTNTLITYAGSSVGGSSGFAGMQLGTLPAGVTANLLNTGSAVQLAVTSVSPPVATNPTNLLAVLGAGKLTLTWPADHSGWRLLMQTNHLASGISANTNDWGAVAGSAATNQVFLPINPAQPAEFYRLVYP